MNRRWFLRGVASLPFVGGVAATASPRVPITVNAGMGANGKEIGDKIVREIRKYERRNGREWRST